MILSILILFGITLIPAFELRASIPYGILSGFVDLPLGWHVQGLGLPWNLVFIICVLSNMILGILIYPLISQCIHWLDHIPLVSRFHHRILDKTQNKIRPYVEKWGVLGVALFVAIPLPGSGSYSGALGSYLLGIRYRSFILANCLGVTLAGIAVTVITISGKSLWQSIF